MHTQTQPATVAPLTATATAGHGVNIGHGYVKYVVINPDGSERLPVVFPAQIARAGRDVGGALVRADTVLMDEHWWAGEDAQLSPSPLTLLSQERLVHPTFIPVLLKAALRRLGLQAGAGGVCVTGLPASWARDEEKARALGERLRAATPGYRRIQVIPEPLGLVYAALLDERGQVNGDLALSSGRIGVIDLGHHTDDICTVDRMRPIDSSLATFQTGTARPLTLLADLLAELAERPLTLAETDVAVRAGSFRISGRPQPLPPGWDRPIRENGESLASKLVERWGRATDLDAILIGGGGAELAPKVQAIQERFPHARVIEQPQTAIARGYARLARRLAGEGK
jgi:hypothetical protein